jgi:hypothetical protein
MFVIYLGLRGSLLSLCCLPVSFGVLSERLIPEYDLVRGAVHDL